jgi:hypothetical protein
MDIMEVNIVALTDTDLKLVISRIPKDVCSIMMRYPIIMGGGFIRSVIAGEEVQDIDIFGDNSDVLNDCADRLVSSRRNIGSRKHHTPNAITVVSVGRMPVQFITRWLYNDPVTLMGSFDFTVCRATLAFRSGKWISCVDQDFYSDLAASRLVYRYPQREEDAGGSILRVRKFLSRGYNIQPPSLAGVIARLTGSIVIGGGEEGYAKAIEKRLVEVDPILIVDGLDVTDEHKQQ